MNIKVGDKVRFLNSKGGGTVTQFKNKEVVMVEEEDGFETPVLIRECVVIAEEVTRTPPAAIEATAKNGPTIAPKAQPKASFPLEETPHGNLLNIQIAFLPHSIKTLSGTLYDAVLVNDSNYFISFAYISLNEKGAKVRYTGVIEPNITLLMETFSANDLNELQHFSFQYFAYKPHRSYTTKEAATVDIKMDVTKFYKLHSFKSNLYFEEDALMVPLVIDDTPVRPMRLSSEIIEEAMISKKQANEQRPLREPIAKKQENKLIEVDLHINELLDTTAGLSNADILEVQLAKFTETMDTYRKQRGQKIVFIHGKGDGVLRKAVIETLQRNYKGCTYQDASFKEYGFGATLVVIRNS